MHLLRYSDDEVISQNLLEDSLDWLWLDESKEEVLIKKKVVFIYICAQFFYL